MQVARQGVIRKKEFIPARIKLPNNKIMVKGGLRHKDLAKRHIRELEQTQRRQRQKTIGFMCKATALHGHHAF